MKSQFIFTFVIVLLLTSCSKNSIENDLVGNWEQLSVGQAQLKDTKVTLTFKADHNLYKTTISPDGLSVDTGQWSVKYNFSSKNTLVIENLEKVTNIQVQDHMNGTHLIHQLDEYLELQRTKFIGGSTTAAFKWSEFEKK